MLVKVDNSQLFDRVFFFLIKVLVIYVMDYFIFFLGFSDILSFDVLKDASER